MLGDAQNADRAGTLLPPGQMFTVRRRAAGDVELLSYGELLRNRVSLYVQGGNGTLGCDSFLGLAQPVPVTLNAAALVDLAHPATSPVRPSASRFAVVDQMLLYSPATVGFGGAPTRAFIYIQGQGWRELGSPAVNIGDTVTLEPGQAVVIRKSKTSIGTDWLQPQ